MENNYSHKILSYEILDIRNLVYVLSRMRYLLDTNFQDEIFSEENIEFIMSDIDESKMLLCKYTLKYLKKFCPYYTLEKHKNEIKSDELLNTYNGTWEIKNIIVYAIIDREINIKFTDLMYRVLRSGFADELLFTEFKDKEERTKMFDFILENIIK